MNNPATLGCLALLVALPCLATAATFNLAQLANTVGSVLRFEQEHGRGVVRKDQAIDSDSEDQLASPAFCNKLDCPKFKIMMNGTGYQMRQYVATNWVSTTSIGIDYDTATHDDFMLLFNYISGTNEKKQKIAMTAPVLNSIVPGQGPACANNFTMSFFLAPKVVPAPKPSDKKVFLSQLPTLNVYVRTFGGHANKDDWLKEALELGKALKKDGKAYNEAYYYTAGYNSPFQLFNRHNEIWFMAM